MKNVTRLLTEAFAKVDKTTKVHDTLKVVEGRAQMLINGEVAISATMAVRIEELTGLNAQELLNAQAADALDNIGYKR